MQTLILTLIAFVAGVATHRARRDDEALNDFADAALCLVSFPTNIVKGLLKKAREDSPPDEQHTTHPLDGGEPGPGPGPGAPLPRGPRHRRPDREANGAGTAPAAAPEGN